MSAPALEALAEVDPVWLYRALAAAEAEQLAEPAIRRRQEREAKERQAAEAERKRAESRALKRQMFRMQQQDQAARGLAPMPMTEPEPVD